MLEKPFLRAIVRCAGEPGKIYQDRYFLFRILYGLWRQIEVECHFAVGSGSIVSKLQELPAKGGDGCFGCDGHVGC